MLAVVQVPLIQYRAAGVELARQHSPVAVLQLVALAIRCQLQAVHFLLWPLPCEHCWSSDR